jgi:hypothetical protein
MKKKKSKKHLSSKYRLSINLQNCYRTVEAYQTNMAIDQVRENYEYFPISVKDMHRYRYDIMVNIKPYYDGNTKCLYIPIIVNHKIAKVGIPRDEILKAISDENK